MPLWGLQSPDPHCLSPLPALLSLLLTSPLTLFLSHPQEPVWPQKWRIGTSHYYHLFRRKWELSLPQGRLRGQFSVPWRGCANVEASVDGLAERGAIWQFSASYGLWEQGWGVYPPRKNTVERERWCYSWWLQENRWIPGLPWVNQNLRSPFLLYTCPVFLTLLLWSASGSLLTFWYLLFSPSSILTTAVYSGSKLVLASSFRSFLTYRPLLFCLSFAFPWLFDCKFVVSCLIQQLLEQKEQTYKFA